MAESDGAQSPRAAANKPSAILAANLATDHAHWHVLFAQNFCHPVNIAGRGNHALLLQMAKLRPSILTAADPVGATAVLSACRDGLEKTVRALVDRHPEIVEHVYGLVRELVMHKALLPRDCLPGHMHLSELQSHGCFAA
eukprot:SAG31_NODE_1863_length_7037_cov_2.325742_8_plen_140_part_00